MLSPRDKARRIRQLSDGKEDKAIHDGMGIIELYYLQRQKIHGSVVEQGNVAFVDTRLQ